ncbi:MAG: isoleucine--tRNA ligase [Chloroflexi bacterium]|nr:isoleucine--tRNA ligase [Chloroflexota bacterium]
MASHFDSVDPKVDFVANEEAILKWWEDNDIPARYRALNDDKEKKFSFIDGPITANNAMGVHHAWGRTYKDLFLRFRNMQGYKQRFQNGFDGQGLWIEVEVEKEMGFKSKRDIEAFGVGKFVEECRKRVDRFAARITEQSKRLGYFMDWDNSYHTKSDENNYTIWHFLKTCADKGWIYKGRDVMPWCPRCGTGLSQHEIVTEGYQDITHESPYLKFPLIDQGHEGENLLVWTTTPWTLAANVAAAVNPEYTYAKVEDRGEILYFSKSLVESLKRDHVLTDEAKVIGEVKGSELVGLKYRGPFDELPAQAETIDQHRVLAWDEVGEDEGTGIVHTAPGAGAEDFKLGKENGLTPIAPLDQNGIYLEGFGEFTGKSAADVKDMVFASLKEKGLLVRVNKYTHRYPVCWRCGTELVFRLVDEWFINMDEIRPKMEKATNEMNWYPEFGKARELDWLKNMQDWMISKKRYYGLALPIYACDCGHFDVIGSQEELKERAVEGWAEFEASGASPHRPWIDGVKIACSECGEPVDRIQDVGNAWLDAGIVPFSTIGYKSDPEYWKEWFPADWISESFPGQFRNWFYSLIVMAAVLEDSLPARNVFAYALMRDENGDEMHKSKGNAIWFEEAADKMGVDVMRWTYSRHNPASNLNFGYKTGDEVRRQFMIPLWNIYSFFTTYANLDGWTPGDCSIPVSFGFDAEGTKNAYESWTMPKGEGFSELDRWILSELNQLIAKMTDNLENWQLPYAASEVEQFVEDLSNWYVRRSRRRFWKTEGDKDKNAAYSTLYTCLTTLSRLLAPFTPFVADIMFRNLVADRIDSAPDSVHLTSWPKSNESLIDEDVMNETRLAIRLASLGRSARAQSRLKVRQPLAEFIAEVRHDWEHFALAKIENVLKEELNVKAVRDASAMGGLLGFEIKPNLRILGPKYGKQIGEIRNALQATDANEIARASEAGEIISIGGFELESDEVLVERIALENYAVATDAGYAGAVFTVVSDELKAEGTAREVVRMIQNLRKTSGLEISDRINLWMSCSDDVTGALMTYSDYIAAETLAENIDLGAVLSDDALGIAATETLILDDDSTITVALEKA